MGGVKDLQAKRRDVTAQTKVLLHYTRKFIDKSKGRIIIGCDK
jgi:hypothetical protein